MRFKKWKHTISHIGSRPPATVGTAPQLSLLEVWAVMCRSGAIETIVILKILRAPRWGDERALRANQSGSIPPAHSETITHGIENRVKGLETVALPARGEKVE